MAEKVGEHMEVGEGKLGRFGVVGEVIVSIEEVTPLGVAEAAAPVAFAAGVTHSTLRDSYSVSGRV